MSTRTALDRYVDAWNSHDSAQVLAAPPTTAPTRTRPPAARSSPEFLNGVFHPATGSTSRSELGGRWL
jgi:hypothetical protein